MNFFKRLFGSDLDKWLLKVISDRDPDKRYRLQRELGDLGSEARKTIVPLANYLESNSPEWREAAAIGIGGIADSGPMNLEQVIKTSLDPLIKSLKDPSPEFRCAAVKALGSVITQFQLDRRVMDGLSPRLARLVVEGVAPLVSMLDDDSVDVRLATAGKLSIGAIDDVVSHEDSQYQKMAHKLFIEALDHESPVVRGKAAASLLTYHDQEIREKAQEIHNSLRSRK